MSGILATGFAGVPFRISGHVRPGEVLVLSPGRRGAEELLLNFETYWAARYSQPDPWWAEFGLRLVRSRTDSSRSGLSLPR